MNELRKLFYLLLIIPIMFVNTGCSDDDGGTDPVAVNETEVLVEYLEANGNPVNTFGQYIPTTTVKTNLDLNSDQYIIDVRSATDFADGHIEGSHRVDATEVLTYYEDNNLSDNEVVVIVCYSGQTAAWATGLLHTIGYTNVKSMSFGLSSWSSTTSGSWVNSISNARASELTTAVTAKAAKGELPELSTGKTEGSEILRARVEAVFAEGFDGVKMTNASAFDSPANYYIVNYWSVDHYNLMHIPSAIQYTPASGGSGSSLLLDADLKTLPTNKPVAVYCYTGQTSAHVAAYLRVLGYDAKTILFGVNAMAHDTMPGTAFDATKHVYDNPLVKD